MSDEAEVWNVLTMKDGALSLLKNLTEDECRAIVQRVRGGNPWTNEAIYGQLLAPLAINNQNRNINTAVFGHYYPTDPGWQVDRCEWWGSKGAELVIWPKPDDYDARFAEAAKIASVVQSTNAIVERARAA